MTILTIRTDKPEAEIGLYNDAVQVAYEIWTAHRQLAETLHSKIRALLASQNVTWSDLDGIVCFQGPGSFTGLRIGLTVANAFAYSYGLLIVAEQSQDWVKSGVERLLAGESDGQALPYYGADAHITPPKK